MSKPDPGSLLGPLPGVAPPVPTPAAKEYSVVLTAVRAVAGRPLFESAIPSGTGLHVSFASGLSTEPGVASGTLTFTSPGNNVEVVSSTCDDVVLALGKSCTFTVAVTPSSGLTAKAGASRVPKFAAGSQLKAAVKGS